MNLGELKKDFTRLAERGRLSHGYIFFGDAPEAQAKFTLQLASYLESGKWDTTISVFIDAMFMNGAFAFGINEARAVTAFLWQKPIKSSKRLVVVQNADQLTLQAENAILKTTEEPPENALIIFLLNSPEALLKPLGSRFQKIYLSDKEHGDAVSKEARAFVNQLLGAGTAREQTEVIKQILEFEEEKPIMKDIVAGLIQYYEHDRLKNWRVMKDFLYRWTLMNQFNTNRQLQLEAALLKAGAY